VYIIKGVIIIKKFLPFIITLGSLVPLVFNGLLISIGIIVIGLIIYLLKRT